MGPTWRIVSANTGASAIESPKSTATRSSEIAPRSMRVWTMNPIPADRFFHVSSTAGAVGSHGLDSEDGDEAEQEQRAGRDVDGDRLELEDHCADCRADDDPELVRHAAEGDGSRQELGRHDLRRQGAPRWVAECRGCACKGADCQEGPELVGARERDQHEDRRDHDLEGEPDGDDRAPGEAVGDLSRRQSEDQQRQELGQPDQAEVEWILVDEVDLHADRDDDHLEREPARQRRCPEERERPNAQSRRQAIAHERER